MFKNNKYKICFIILFILIIDISSTNAQTYCYVINPWGHIYEINYETLKIIKESDAFGLISPGHVIYDKNAGKIYGKNIDDWNIFNINTFSKEQIIKLPSPYNAIGNRFGFNMNKDQIYIPGVDIKVEPPNYKTIIYNKNDYSIINEINENNINVVDYRFSSDGKYMFRSGIEIATKKVIVEKWDAETFGLITTFYCPENISVINDIEISLDNNKIYLNVGGKEILQIIVIDTNNGNIIKNINIEQVSMTLTNDGNYLYYLSMNNNNERILYRINTSTYEKEEDSLGLYANIYGAGITAISSDNSILALSYGTGYRKPGYLNFVDLKNKKIIGQIEISGGEPVCIYFK